MISIGNVQEWLENHSHEGGDVLKNRVPLSSSGGDAWVVAAQSPQEAAEGDGLLAAASASFRGRKSLFRAEHTRPGDAGMALRLG